MSSWRSWRKRRFAPVIIQHEKELPKWRIATSILLERIIKYPNYKLARWAAFGFFGVVFLYVQGLQWTQRRLYRSPFVKHALEIFQTQKKLISLVGEPLKFGWIHPSQKNSIQDDFVDILIPITGANAEGVLSLEAHKVADSWVVDDLSFEFIDTAGGVVQIVKEEH